MVAIGFLLLWGGYAGGLFGWCLFKDYDVTLGELMSPFHPYAGAWPPAQIPAGQIWPGGSGSASSSAGSSSSGSGGLISDLASTPLGKLVTKGKV